jgi:hypothetical protein
VTHCCDGGVVNLFRSRAAITLDLAAGLPAREYASGARALLVPATRNGEPGQARRRWQLAPEAEEPLNGPSPQLRSPRPRGVRLGNDSPAAAGRRSAQRTQGLARLAARGCTEGQYCHGDRHPWRRDRTLARRCGSRHSPACAHPAPATRRRRAGLPESNWPVGAGHRTGQCPGQAAAAKRRQRPAPNSISDR